MSQPDTIELVPSHLDGQGAGVAALDDLDVHVAGALPGERITAQVVHRSPHRRADGRRDAWATLVAVQAPSAWRVSAPCPAYGACGGCVLAHLALPQQLAWKEAQVAEALAQLDTSSHSATPVLVLPALASPSPVAYRNQAKYVVAAAPDAGAPPVLGAYAPRSHQVVDLAGCRLLEPALDPVAQGLRRLLHDRGVVPFDERTRTGQLRYVVLRGNAHGEVLVALVTARAEFPQGRALAQALRAQHPNVVGVVQNVNASPGNVIFGREEHLLDGRSTVPESIAGVSVDIAAAAFLQLNRGVAAAAYAAIRACIQKLMQELMPSGQPLARVVDVYSGVGAIALSVADLARELVAIEENPAATAAGAAACARAGQAYAHLRFVTAEAAAGIASVPTAEVVVLNPPRAGAGAQVIAALLHMQPRPRRIVYLSCNPATLARDLALLAAPGAGFQVTQVQPFDMLPHTTHVETFAVLSRD